MNMVIFDLVNVCLFAIFIVAGFNFSWHLKFKRNQTFPGEYPDKNQNRIRAKVSEIATNYYYKS